jgi:hypothetical protein
MLVQQVLAEDPFNEAIVVIPSMNPQPFRHLI